MNTSDILERIKTAIAALEQGRKDELDEFDTIADSISIINQGFTFLKLVYEPHKLRQWKENQDPAFDRFASKLKTALESGQDYLESVSDLFSSEPDIISQKIILCSSRLTEIKKQHDLIFKHTETLLSREKELSEQKKRVDNLLCRKAELEKIEQEISAHDLETLENEIAAKVSIRQKFEHEYEPLLKKKQALENKCLELRETIQKLSNDIEKLETAYGQEALELSLNLPEWVQKLKNRKENREEKDIKYIQELEQETGELKSVETRVQEHLRQITEFAESRAVLQEVLHVHFQADRHLEKNFPGSTAALKEEALEIGAQIEENLEKFDNCLKKMHQQIEKAAFEIKAMGLN